MGWDGTKTTMVKTRTKTMSQVGTSYVRDFGVGKQAELEARGEEERPNTDKDRRSRRAEPYETSKKGGRGCGETHAKGTGRQGRANQQSKAGVSRSQTSFPLHSH